MAGEIGKAYVDVELDSSGVQSQLGGLGGQLRSQLGPLGGMIEGALSTPWTAAAAAAVGGAVVIGKALYGIGADFDDMSDTIAVATGATGKELEGLTDSAKEVGTIVPASFADIGTALGKLEPRFVGTDDQLTDLTATVVALAKVTDKDLNTVVESSSRFLGDWGLHGEAAAEGLDTVFRASQATGTEVDRLTQLLTKFGGPMRALGFSMEETAALLGQFEAQGVNTELVVGSLRIAIGKWADAQKDPQTELRNTMKAIQDADTVSEAYGISLKTFGKRAGVDMADAIRAGRLSIDDLVKSIGDGQTTILGAEKNTRDFAEQWTLFKNQLKVAVAPAAEGLFAVIGDGMAYLTENLPAIIDMLEKQLGPAFADIADAIRELWPLVVELAPLFKVALAGTILTLKQTAAAVRLFATVLAETVKLVKAIFTGDWAAAWNAAKAIVAAFGTYFQSAIGNYLGYLRSVTEPFRSAATGIGNAIKNGVMSVVNTIDNAIRGALNLAKQAVVGMIDDYRAVGERVGTAIWNGIKAGVAAATALGSVVSGYVSRGVQAAVSAAYSAGSAVGRAIYNGILDALRGIGDAIRNLIPSPGDLLGGIKGAIPGLRSAPDGGGTGPAPAPAALSAFGLLGAAPQAAGAGGGGLAGPVPLGSRLARAFGSASISVSGVAGVPEVRVFIGDRELTHIVRTEVVRSDTGLARTLLSGGRTA